MYIYGLDLSMSNTGVTIIDSETNEVAYIGSISTTSKELEKLPIEYKHGKKLKHQFDEINKLIDEYPPEVAVVERGFTRFNNPTQVLFRVHGIFNLAFCETKTIYYTPKEIKNCIYQGNASKEEIANVLSNRLNLKFKNEDESDSTAIAMTYLINEKGYEWKKVKALTEKDKLNAKRRKEKEELKKKKS